LACHGVLREFDPGLGLGVIALLVFSTVLWQGASLLSVWIAVKNTHYKLSNQRLLIEAGWLSKSVEDIDVRTIDDTSFRQTIMERLLSIGDVTVMSSDKAEPVLTMRGIDDPRRVRELIRTAGFDASKGQVFFRPA
jgi:uncharacterized membrane protein YdbT with pleckstrin-like domain